MATNPPAPSLLQYSHRQQPHRDATLLDPLLSALKQRYLVSSSSVTDPLQFCADFFNARLADERFHFLSTRHPTFDTLSHSTSRLGMTTSAVHSVAEEEDHQDSPSSTTPPTTSSDRAAPSTMSAASPFGNFGGFNPGGGPPSAPSTGAASAEDAQLPTNYNYTRRISVSAESLTPESASKDNWSPPSHPKTQDQLDRLRTAVSSNFLFSSLADEQSTQVLGALQERSIPKEGIRVIQQGDAGDYFYIVEKGNFDIYVNPSGAIEAGPDGLGKIVAQVGPGGSFGELALMYNAPRAATVVATGPSTLWALDRVTFRRILMNTAFERRRMYEGFLSEVPLLESLTPYERSKIADALETVKYKAGDKIITEGEPGENFYILEDGIAEVYREDTEGCVKTYGKGDYFGELALLNNAPRAASVIAKTESKVAQLGKKGFNRLLGTVEGIMRRNDYSSGEVDPLHKG